MIPNTTLDYLDQFNKHFVKEKTQEADRHRDHVEHLEKRHSSIRDRILKTTQSYLEKGYCDYNDRGGWSIMKPNRGHRERFDMPFENYLRGIAKELNRPWVCLSYNSIEIPNTRACRVLSNPFLMLMQDANKAYKKSWSPSTEAPVARCRYSKFDVIWLQDETSSALKQAWIEWVRDNPDCRKVLKTGEFLTSGVSQ